MSNDTILAGDSVHESGRWNCEFKIEKFWGDDVEGQEPYETIVTDNLLMYGGVSCLWQGLLGNMTATTGQALTKFDNANAAIGVGDSTTAEAATHTNLQASTNKLRKGMNATYPVHTDGTVVGAASIQFQSTFGTAEGNYAWQECAVFNSATDGTGRMLNRKVQSLGTKTSASSWQVTVTITIS
jgi:hypothetical protein